MIWAIVSKDEMENYKIPPVFQYYREVIGKENITLAVVEEDDQLDFIQESDIALLRSANKKIISNIRKKNIASTAEDYDTYAQVEDKADLGKFLSRYGILVPRQYQLQDVEDGKIYFVKPRYGGESFGITEKCICTTKEDVELQVQSLKEEYNKESVIEDFIDGVDCTVACYYDRETNSIKTHAIKVECDAIGGIQTHRGKFNYSEYCSALRGDEQVTICRISEYIFKKLKIKHHARIDFRMTNDGQFFMIDVNLLPGLGPSAHFSKCLLLSDNISYKDSIWSIIYSAMK